MKLHKKLNLEQKKIIEDYQGIIRVISGPGTGKSTTCIHYIGELISTQKAKGENILAVTFTNKGASQLKDRVIEMVGRSPDVSTIHSFCANGLRKFPPPGYSNNFSIMDEGGQFITVGNLVKDLGLGIHPRFILEKLTLARNLRDINILKAEGLEDFYPIYMTNLQSRDIIDYDGLLTWCLYTFEKNPKALEYFQDKYKYILVDEFQDVSPIQLEIIKLLIGDRNNLIVVGDPDQSIYKFRGADVSIMVNLDKVFPIIKTYYLAQNYRSTEKIIKAANNLIKNNKFRLEKPLWTERGQGEKVEVLSFIDESQEAQYLADYIKSWVSKGGRYGDIGILYRVNTLATEFETVFSKEEVPYQIVGGIGYYQRAEIKNTISFFKLATMVTNNEAFLKAASVLAQIEGKSIKKFKAIAYNNPGAKLIDLAYRAEERFVREFPDFIHQLNKERDLVNIFNLIMARTKYIEHLRKDNSTEGERRVENLEELKSILVRLKAKGKGIQDFLEIAESTKEEKNRDAVNLMTVHSAKGLEFDTVFIVGAVKGMYPYYRGEREGDIEEERRLFYVAVTRAQNRLIITYPREGIVKGEKKKKEPSQFIQELKLSKMSAKSYIRNIVNLYI